MEWPKDQGSGTRGAWKSVGASVLLHVAVAAGALYTVSAMPPSREPIVVDLTVEGDAGPEAVAAPRPEPPQAALPVQPPHSPTPVPVPESRTAQPFAAPAPPVPAQPGVVQAELPPPVPSGTAGGTERSAPAPTPGGLPGGIAAVPVSVPAGAGSPHGASAGTATSRAEPGTGAGTEEPGEARAKARGRYLERDYAYIRDAIQQGIAYPDMARKMGWEGRVVVAFLVLSDGSVRDVRVVKGSGHPALDRGAVEAVRKAAPFPSPPAEAEIITPVVYRLE